MLLAQLPPLREHRNGELRVFFPQLPKKKKPPLAHAMGRGKEEI